MQNLQIIRSTKIMKATTWLCPMLIVLCASRLVCTAQRASFTIGYHPLNYMASNMLQDDNVITKRNKPSLSIVNPLDVLRQRLLLEIARRQMKENTRQVELNRAILKNVGKRMFNTPSTNSYTWHNVVRPKEREQQDELYYKQQSSYGREMPEKRHLLSPVNVMPSATIFDYLIRPGIEYEQRAITTQLHEANNAKNDDEVESDIDVVNDGKTKISQISNSAFPKHFQPTDRKADLTQSIIKNRTTLQQQHDPKNNIPIKFSDFAFIDDGSNESFKDTLVFDEDNGNHLDYQTQYLYNLSHDNDLQRLRSK
uniref:Corticotropin-releasing factor domain-containing protein n=1 Tax=Glossina palpalis gambiensis TaxID=67801 RepID=A0A1B0C237_9MUSC